MAGCSRLAGSGTRLYNPFAMLPSETANPSEIS